MKYGLFFMFLLLATEALASQPTPWQMGFQPSLSPIQDAIVSLHNHILLPIIAGICLIVLGVLLFIMLRFNEKKNPIPSTTSHNTKLEIVWFTIPTLLIIAIAIPSIRTLFYIEEIKDPEMTLKVVGRQWYWSYEYPDHDNISFDSNIIKDAELKPGQLRLLEVDSRVVLPVDTVIRVQMTASDVIHAWFIPALGFQKNAIPGKLNEMWLKIDKPGVYYGQCNYLCGQMHAFMPIVVEARSKEEFNQWVQAKKAKAALEHKVAGLSE